MFKMGCMARKILAPGSSSSGGGGGGETGNSNEQELSRSGGGGGAKRNKKDKAASGAPMSPAAVGAHAIDELGDFSKLEEDPRLPLNKRQIFKISKSWKAIARTMSRTGTAMFLNLFEQNQELFYLFDRFQHLKGQELHESMELREHAATVMSTLDQSINSLSNYDNFVNYLHSIGQLHRKVPGFQRDYFWKIEQPFMKAVKQTLDERCNETIEEIYKIAIKLIIETIADGYGVGPASGDSGVTSADKSGGGGSGGGGDGGGGPGNAQSQQRQQQQQQQHGSSKSTTSAGGKPPNEARNGPGPSEAIETTVAPFAAAAIGRTGAQTARAQLRRSEREATGSQSDGSIRAAAPSVLAESEPKAEEETRRCGAAQRQPDLMDKQARLLLERLLLVLRRPCGQSSGSASNLVCPSRLPSKSSGAPAGATSQGPSQSVEAALENDDDEQQRQQQPLASARANDDERELVRLLAVLVELRERRRWQADSSPVARPASELAAGAWARAAAAS